jgi:hypothetical protein
MEEKPEYPEKIIDLQQATDKLYHIEYTCVFELTIVVVVICTDCTGSCKSICHPIMTTTASNM